MATISQHVRTRCSPGHCLHTSRTGFLNEQVTGTQTYRTIMYQIVHLIESRSSRRQWELCRQKYEGYNSWCQGPAKRTRPQAAARLFHLRLLDFAFLRRRLVTMDQVTLFMLLLTYVVPFTDIVSSNRWCSLRFCSGTRQENPQLRIIMI